MESTETIEEIQEHCKTVALAFMKIHPVVGKLKSDELRGICLKSLHAMTTELEVMKKHLIKSQNRDDSSDL